MGKLCPNEFIKCWLLCFEFAFCSICRCYGINDVFGYLFIVVLRNGNEVTCFKHYMERVITDNFIHRAASKGKECLQEGILFLKCMFALSKVEVWLLLHNCACICCFSFSSRRRFRRTLTMFECVFLVERVRSIAFIWVKHRLIRLFKLDDVERGLFERL